MPTILGLGEILWDLLPGGKQLGGATANFAFHAHALGAQAVPVSRIGNDPLGEEILDRLSCLGLPLSGIQVDSAAPTGTVEVELLDGGQHRFTIHENVAWDRIEADGPALALAARADAVCFGTLAQRCQASRSGILALIAAVPPEALQIFDINLRQHYFSRDVILHSLEIADVLKINDEELPVVAQMLALRGAETDQLAQLADRYSLRMAALTRGERGSVLLAGDRISEAEGITVEVVDTIGAGDAFTAAMALGWLAGWDLDTINRRANAVASYVCTQSGATPTLPAELAAPFIAM
jgi:fructokinase